MSQRLEIIEGMYRRAPRSTIFRVLVRGLNSGAYPRAGPGDTSNGPRKEGGLISLKGMYTPFEKTKFKWTSKVLEHTYEA